MVSRFLENIIICKRRRYYAVLTNRYCYWHENTSTSPPRYTCRHTCIEKYYYLSSSCKTSIFRPRYENSEKKKQWTWNNNSIGIDYWINIKTVPYRKHLIYCSTKSWISFKSNVRALNRKHYIFKSLFILILNLPIVIRAGPSKLKKKKYLKYFTPTLVPVAGFLQLFHDSMVWHVKSRVQRVRRSLYSACGYVFVRQTSFSEKYSHCRWSRDIIKYS